MSSSPSSVRSQVHWASGVKSLTTGLKSMSGSALSMRTIWAWQFARSCSCWVLVKSVIGRFLVLADPNGPVTKAPEHSGPPRTENHQLDLELLVSGLGGIGGE